MKGFTAVFKQTVQLARYALVRWGLAHCRRWTAPRSGHRLQRPQGWRKEYMEKLLAQLDGALEDIEGQVLAENADGDDTGLSSYAPPG